MNVIRPNDSDRTAPKQPNAVAGLDVLRVFATMAVVVLHASVPYLRIRMPGLVWPVGDNSSRWVDAVFWGIEVMIMPLFLVIAGFLLWRSSRRLSPGQLVSSRAKRILIPLAFGILVILPIDLYIWTVGLVADGAVEPIKLKSLKFDTPISNDIWGLAHLWFLLYVFLYVVVAAVLFRLASLGFVKRVAKAVSRPKVLLPTLSCIAVATLFAAPEVVWGFQHTFLPVPSKWIYSGVFFAAGCGLGFHDGKLKLVSRSAPRILVIGVILLVSSVTLGTWSLQQLESGRAINHAATFLLAILTVAAASTVTLGVIGASVRSVKQIPQTIRYLASASFWIYLIHHPLLGLIHTDIKWIWPQGPPFVKLCVSFVAATGISILLYEAFIRRSRLGELLGFNHSEQANPPDRPEDDETKEVLKLPESKTDRRHAA